MRPRISFIPRWKPLVGEDSVHPVLFWMAWTCLDTFSPVWKWLLYITSSEEQKFILFSSTLAGAKKKADSEEDVLVMDTKLKIIEILQVTKLFAKSRGLRHKFHLRSIRKIHLHWTTWLWSRAHFQKISAATERLNLLPLHTFHFWPVKLLLRETETISASSRPFQLNDKEEMRFVCSETRVQQIWPWNTVPSSPQLSTPQKLEDGQNKAQNLMQSLLAVNACNVPYATLVTRASCDNSLVPARRQTGLPNRSVVVHHQETSGRTTTRW